MYADGDCRSVECVLGQGIVMAIGDIMIPCVEFGDACRCTGQRRCRVLERLVGVSSPPESVRQRSKEVLDEVSNGRVQLQKSCTVAACQRTLPENETARGTPANMEEDQGTPHYVLCRLLTTRDRIQTPDGGSVL